MNCINCRLVLLDMVKVLLQICDQSSGSGVSVKSLFQASIGREIEVSMDDNILYNFDRIFLGWGILLISFARVGKCNSLLAILILDLRADFNCK